uniref:Secreted protein n=1 Tax=Physcomitrium patens TaxID=3218 RepID=A0A2K1LBD4_PHYPA|nr:hypothetical protein PHYPA_001770 [Physcomitrium patens]
MCNPHLLILFYLAVCGHTCIDDLGERGFRWIFWSRVAGFSCFDRRLHQIGRASLPLAYPIFVQDGENNTT